MATSRTGTATWKNLVVQAKARAKHQGITHCRHCKVELNYKQGLLPNSAEPDHVIPHKFGGKDHIDNLEVICRQCNQSKGHRAAPKVAQKDPPPLKTSRKW